MPKQQSLVGQVQKKLAMGEGATPSERAELAERVRKLRSMGDAFGGVSVSAHVSVRSVRGRSRRMSVTPTRLSA